MKRKPLLTIVVVLAGLVLTACNHFSTQEAFATCEKLVAVGAPADSEETFADCVACYEDCGSSCELSAESEEYVCPDE